MFNFLHKLFGFDEENDDFNAENVLSKQIFKSKLDKNELEEYFKDRLLIKIKTISSSTYQSDIIAHFASIEYPYYLDDSQIKNLIIYFENKGFIVNINKELGFFIASWNHKYKTYECIK